MNEQYVVRDSRGGIVGTLTGREIRRRLAAGTLQPTDSCLPISATGDLSTQWRTLAVAFLGAAPEASHARPVPEPRAAPRAPAVPLAVALGAILLTFGQFVSLLGCAASVVAGFLVLSGAAGVQYGSELFPIGLGVCGALLGCGFWAALFVVFARVKRLPFV